MYDEELIDHNNHPEFRGEISGVQPIGLVNSSCGDELKIYLKVADGVIVDGRFSGVGCAISQASADVFVATVKGMTIEQAREARDDFYKLVVGEKISAESIKKARCLSCVSRMPARVKCAKLAWESLERL